MQPFLLFKIIRGTIEKTVVKRAKNKYNKITKSVKRDEFMKKIYLIVATACVAVSLCACGAAEKEGGFAEVTEAGMPEKPMAETDVEWIGTDTSDGAVAEGETTLIKMAEMADKVDKGELDYYSMSVSDFETQLGCQGVKSDRTTAGGAVFDIYEWKAPNENNYFDSDYINFMVEINHETNTVVSFSFGGCTSSSIIEWLNQQ